MQNFNKKQMAIAVGAALAAASGGAMAAASSQALLNKVLVGNNNLSATDKVGLYSATGVRPGKFSLKLVIGTDGVNADTVNVVKWGTDSLGSNGIIAGTQPTLGIDAAASAADTINNFLIVATDGTTTVNLANLVDSVGTFATAGLAYTVRADIDSTKLATDDRFKIDSVGNLQYSSNAGSTWLPVKVSLQNVTGDSLGFFVDGTGDSVYASSTDSSNMLRTFAAAQPFAGNTIVPTATVATRADTAASVPGALVNGVTLNTYGSLAAMAASSLKVATRAGTLDTTVGATAVTIDSSNGTLTTSGSAASWTISFSPATANLDTADTAADPELYTAKGFNTGVAGATVPFTVDANSVDSLAPVFSTVFKEAADSTFGLASSLLANASAGTGVKMPGNAVATDAVQPVVTGTTYNPASKTMTISFSEPIQTNSGGAVSANDILEAVQNISYGTAPGTTLAAANFNAGGDVDEVTVTNTNGVGALAIGTTIDSLSGTTAFLGNSLLINKRLSVTEPGEAANSVVDSTFDAAGFKSVAGEILTTANNTNTISVTPETVTLAFDGETKAQAVMAPDNKNVKQIDITYPYTISQDSTSSFKDHFKLTVWDGANGATVTPNVTSAFLDSTHVTVSGKVISVALPTNLTLQNMSAVAVQYNSAWGDGKAALKFTDSASSSSGTVSSATLDSNEISLPFFLTAGQAPLYTQETSIDLNNVSGNSKITGYLAKWLDAKVEDKLSASSIKITTGKVTDPNNANKVAADLSLEIANGVDSATTGDTTSGLLSYLIATELNKAAPGLIPVVIELQKSNDQINGGGVAGGDAAGEAAWLQAHAKIAGSRTAAVGTNAGTKDPLYDVMLDPKTGNISGRLVGNLRFTATKGTKSARGLVYINSSGDFTSNSGSAATTSVATDGNGKANLIIGVDATPSKLPNLTGAFILAVHTDVNDQTNPVLVTSAEPGQRNFVAFVPNLITGKDGRAALGGKDSTGALLPVDASLIKPTAKLAASTAWQLVGVGNLDRKSTAPGLVAKDWPRLFVTLDGSGVPIANWTGVGDTGSTDLAMTMAGNKSGVASEATGGDTVSTIALGANAVAQRFAFAFANDGGTADKLFFLTKASTPTSIPVGWSLVTAPAAWNNAGGIPTDISHVLKVGAGYSGVSTFVRGTGSTEDGATNPAGLVAADEPVFVFARKIVAGQ